MKPKKWSGVVEAIGNKYDMVVYPPNKEVTFVLSKRSDQKDLPSLDQYVEKLIADASGKLEGFEVLEKENTTVVDQPAIKILTTQDEKGSTKKKQITYMIHENDLYMFTYNAKPDLYDKHVDTIQKMMESIKIENI